MGDQTEDRIEREHRELALLVAHTQDDYIRAHGTDGGSAKAVANAIQEAGFTREPLLSEDELELLRTALQVAIGRSKQTARGGSYRKPRSRQDRAESARTRRYRVLLEKLGGPKIPVAPVVDEPPADGKSFEEKHREADAQRAQELERKREREMLRRRTIPNDPYWRYRDRLRGVPQEPVGATDVSERSDDARKSIGAVETAAEASWSVFNDRSGIDDGSEDFAHSELFGVRDVEDRSLEYGIANFGDLEDVITEHGAERSSLSWARAAILPSYGDLLVARPWSRPKPAS